MEALLRDLRALGLKEGDVVLVHSSLSRLGRVEGGAETVIRALQALLTEKGTLLFPALSYDFVPPENPVFDLRSTPCCVGLIPETFRKMPGVIRSLHPTHSVCAWGRLSGEITADHALDDTPVGEHSPFRKLPRYGGKILMLGCKVHSLTFMHGVEEIACSPYCLTKERFPFTLTDGEGKVVERQMYRHDFWNHTVIQRYDRVPALLSEEECRVGKVLEGTAHLLSAAAVEKKALEQLKKDPFFFVDVKAQ